MSLEQYALIALGLSSVLVALGCYWAYLLFQEMHKPRRRKTVINLKNDD